MALDPLILISLSLSLMRRCQYDEYQSRTAPVRLKKLLVVVHVRHHRLQNSRLVGQRCWSWHVRCTIEPETPLPALCVKTLLPKLSTRKTRGFTVVCRRSFSSYPKFESSPGLSIHRPMRCPFVGC